MVERRQGNLLAVGLPCIDSEILPRRNRAFSLSARLLECVAIQTHPYGRKYQALNSRGANRMATDRTLLSRSLVAVIP